MSSIVQKQIGYLPGPLPLITTNELVIAYTGRCEANLPTMRAIVRGWATVTGGASTTAFVMRIRRGNGLAGLSLFIGNLITLAGANTLDSTAIFAETLQNVEYVDYTLTAQLAGATGNGVVPNASIEVELING